MPSDFIVPITAQVASISTSADVSVISTISRSGAPWCELNRVAQPVRPIRIVQRGGREVYRETRGRVLPQTCKGEVEDATIEQADEARLFRNRQQAGGSNDRPIRQHKPEQRFLERDCA
jgi:hypothetical protein